MGWVLYVLTTKKNGEHGFSLAVHSYCRTPPFTCTSTRVEGMRMRVCNVYLSMALTMKHLIFWGFALKFVDEGGCRDVTARKIKEQEDAYTKTVIYNPSLHLCFFLDHKQHKDVWMGL